jgi:uncharacterized protein with ParB-like and HNH nuclease domain
MERNIETIPRLIREYLNLKDKIFVIPAYQREYSWDKTDCDKLWQDIEYYIESNGSEPYFFGTIIVDHSNKKEVALIDGQQRTTTFLLLFKALLLRLDEAISKLEKFKNDGDSAGTKRRLESSRETIMEILYKAEIEDIPDMVEDFSKVKDFLVLETRSISEIYTNEMKVIIRAENFEEAEKKVIHIKYKRNDNRYTNYFRNFKSFYDKLWFDGDYFDLKEFARVFLEKCQIIEIRSWETEQAITMFNSLNSRGLPLSDANIIQAKLYTNAGNDVADFNDKWKEIIILANKLKLLEIVDIDAVLMQFMYINRARKEDSNVMTPAVRRYYTDKKELLADPEEFCRNIIKILETWEKIKDYPIVKLLLKINENAKFYLSGYLYRYEPKEITIEKVQDICECLLRLFAILELVDAGYSSKNFKSFLFHINIKLVNKDILIQDIVQEFNMHINKNWKKDDLINDIFEYDKNTLVFLNDYLYAKSKGKDFDFKKSVNIEHIMPGSGRNINIIRKDAGIESEEEFISIVNKIGNKILLEEVINKSIGNEWFRTKKQNSIKEKTGYKDSRFAIAQALTEYHKDIWGIDDIKTATEKASERIVKFIFKT